MQGRTFVLALAVVALPLAAAAQAPEPAVPHPPGAHETTAPHPQGAHEPGGAMPPSAPHPADAHAPGQAEVPSAPHPAGAHEDKPAPKPKAYVPGLELFMGLIQNQHAKLWYAGRARNWPLAAYQLGEIKEIMSDVQDFIPTFKSLPLADMLDAVITHEIAALEKAVDAKDAKAFAAGFGALTAACNACHQATGNGFIHIQRPGRGTFPNQDFRPHPQ